MKLKFTLGLSAPDFIAAGGMWEPQLQFHGTTKDWKDFEKIVREYSSYVVAHYLMEYLPGYYSLEYQFGEDEASQEAYKACRMKCRAIDNH